VFYNFRTTILEGDKQMFHHVYKKMEDDSKVFFQINIKDVLYINIENRHVVFHTRDDKFYVPDKLEDYEEMLFQQGFELTDKTNLVNLNEIRYLDEDCNNLYFEEQPNLKKAKKASVAAIQLRARRRSILNAIARNNGRTMTFNSNRSSRISSDKLQET
jgi:DNA-binding LytR/AlgR family response regulator